MIVVRVALAILLFCSVITAKAVFGKSKSECGCGCEDRVSKICSCKCDEEKLLYLPTGGFKPKYTANITTEYIGPEPPPCIDVHDPLVVQDRSGFHALRWRFGIFPVVFHQSISSQSRDMIQNVLVKLGKLVPCLDIRIHNDTKGLQRTGYLHVRGDDLTNGLCWSEIGMMLNMFGLGRPRKMNLAPQCMTEGRIFHEFMHALGFAHEHCRPDRNNHIQILEHNIEKGAADQFRLAKASETYGVEYDLTSIMHYPLNAFGIKDQNTRLPIPTMKILGSNEFAEFWAPKVGQRNGPSFYDVQKLRLMYRGTFAEEVCTKSGTDFTNVYPTSNNGG